MDDTVADDLQYDETQSDYVFDNVSGRGNSVVRNVCKPLYKGQVPV